MENVKQYTVICETSLKELKQTINSMIEDKWQPTGGVSIINLTTVHGPDVRFYQALVMY